MLIIVEGNEENTKDASGDALLNKSECQMKVTSGLCEIETFRQKKRSAFLIHRGRYAQQFCLTPRLLAK